VKRREHITEIKECKLENGYTIINQADCYRYIFKDIVEEEVLFQKKMEKN